MNKNIIFTIFLISGLTSCDILVTNSSNSIDESTFERSESVSEMISKISESEENSSILDISSNEEASSSEEEISSEDGSSEETKVLHNPTIFYTIEVDDISDRYEQGETILINQWTNIIILDNKGRIFYSVANAGCGYGTNGNYGSIDYYFDDVESYIKNGYIEVPSGMVGYLISYEAYGQLSYDMSNGSISKNEFEDHGYENTIKVWNSKNNPYFTDNVGITIEEKEKEEVNLTIRNSKEFRLSSISDKATTNGVSTYKMRVPYDDTYTISCLTSTKIELYNQTKALISTGKSSISVTLNKDDLVYLSLTTNVSANFSLSVNKSKHKVELPYEVKSLVDASSLSTTGSTTSSPLKSCNIAYTKRSDSRGLYINDNNPEKLTTSNINTVTTSQDITEKDVFFTFEHNNVATNYYYGYRVTNTGNEDLYITVKNLGYQVKGSGSWLGEDEWTKFYNLNFNIQTSNLTSSQKANYNAYVGFCGTYKTENRQPITYRIPTGKYIYVMGGTSADAYNNINVFNSANVTVNGGCGNGAVIFETHGSTALGQFCIYKDASTITTSTIQNGYVGNSTYGSQYVGYDNCHGVVDADLCWTFNDKTAAQSLPVSYNNPNYVSSSRKGTRYATIASSAFTNKAYSSVTTWHTHVNPNHVEGAIGTDMTKYITVDSETKNPITIDYLHYDGKGNTVNIGNWMVDYIDTFTLVNQGNNSRNVKVELVFSGVVLAFVRDENGYVSSSYTPTYCCKIAGSDYGAAIDNHFVYEVTVPAHSISRFSIDYNLCANSYGDITHSVTLL